ncbi:peptidase [Petralouisia muris]|uniref:Peptidase n=1 Tax=Petralouisia muris TaxID=3032872 RepID=A0AC61RZL8_9FIRM|nr:S8 family peptidase [Petralouisia muris]TGY97343.1 peptidase [Petralouisia muris]
MDCEEAVYSNDYYDFIVEYTMPESGNVVSSCIQKIDASYGIAYLPREGNLSLNIQNYNYTSIPKCYTLMDESALEESGILRIQNQPTLSLKGQGVLIGFLDTGIDYENPVFRNSDGSTRIMAVWDQTDRSGTPPEGFLYGTEYLDTQINDALQTENPREIVPVTDPEGHGTFLVSVAAGSQIREEEFIGAAPYARIAMVKLKQAKQYLRDFFFIPEDAQAFQENDLMAGLAYLDQLAKSRHVPLVICFGLGSNMGSHTGVSHLSTMLNNIALRSGRVAVTAVGNEGNERHHYFGQMEEGRQYQNVEISVGEGVEGFSTELWARAPQRFVVEIISPTGERMPSEYILSGGREYRFLFEDTRVTVDYRITGILNGAQVIYMRFEQPSQGLWNIRVFPEGEFASIFNMWLPSDELSTGEVFFIRSNPDTTITVPSTAIAPIAVGAYDVRDNSIYLRSGRGFTTNGWIKPDIVAPGVGVFGAGGNNQFTTKDGTSVAAAITAGATALMLEWGIVRGNYTAITNIEIKNVLIRGATRDDKRTYPDQAFGWGRLNLYQAFEDFRIR